MSYGHFYQFAQAFPLGARLFPEGLPGVKEQGRKLGILHSKEGVFRADRTALIPVFPYPDPAPAASGTFDLGSEL